MHEKGATAPFSATRCPWGWCAFAHYKGHLPRRPDWSLHSTGMYEIQSGANLAINRVPVAVTGAPSQTRVIPGGQVIVNG